MFHEIVLSFYRAHLIQPFYFFGPLKIQVIQLVTRKAVTVEAVPNAAWRYLFTVLDSTGDAGF
jgi:hypothetical protein